MTQDPIDQDREQLADAFRTFIDQGEDLLRNKAGEVGEVAAAGRAKLEAQVAEARRKLSNLEGKLTDRARAAARSTDNYVHQHPWESVGIAAGVGVILGLLIGRR